MACYIVNLAKLVKHTANLQNTINKDYGNDNTLTLNSETTTKITKSSDLNVLLFHSVLRPKLNRWVVEVP